MNLEYTKSSRSVSLGEINNDLLSWMDELTGRMTRHYRLYSTLPPTLPFLLLAREFLLFPSYTGSPVAAYQVGERFPVGKQQAQLS